MIKDFNKLSISDKKLITVAEEAMENGYDPYAHFYVGSALLTEKGTVYKGSNLATATYLGICAERNAIGAAITNKEYRFKKIALISRSDYFDVTELSGPCGLCRQILWEFAELINSDIQILSSDSKKGKVLVTSIKKLHPYGFGPRLCDGNVEKYLV